MKTSLNLINALNESFEKDFEEKVAKHQAEIEASKEQEVKDLKESEKAEIKEEIKDLEDKIKDTPVKDLKSEDAEKLEKLEDKLKDDTLTEEEKSEETTIDVIKRRVAELQKAEDDKYEEIKTKPDGTLKEGADPKEELFHKYRDEFDSMDDVWDLADTVNELYEEGGMKAVNDWFLPAADEEYKKLVRKLIVKSDKNLKEDEVIEISQTEPELDYVITDVTELEDTTDGDVQAPDIDAMLTMLGESFKEEYGEAIKINILSSSLLENGSFALVDISTPQILKEFEEKHIYDAAVGKNLVLEHDGDYYTFKVNSLNGTTRYSKRTTKPIEALREWIETEFLTEAKKEKEERLAFMKAKTEKETVESYIAERPELKMEVENIKMFIELSKGIGNKDEMRPTIQNRMYGFAAEFPNNIEVTNKDDKYELKFNKLDDIVEIIFGKEWVKKAEEELPGNEVIGLKENEKADALIKDYFNHKISTLDELHNKLEKEFDTKKDAVEYFADNEARIKKTLKESYDQFNIGNIDVVYNPQTQECLYSIESADVHDKKINLSKVPSVETPYDTDTIIKDYIEKQYGPIPQEVENDKEEPEGEALPPLPAEEAPIETEVVEEAEGDEEVPTPADMGIDTQPAEDAEVDDQPSAETGSAYFVKIRPGKAKAGIEDIRQQQKDGVVQQKSSYLVVEEVNLSKADFDAFTSDFSQPRDFLTEIKPLDRKNYAFNVVKVTGDGVPYSVLVDPTGFNYARYVGVSDEV